MVDGASQGLARATRRLAGAVARFAGWRGIGAALLVASGAMIEGLTILLLIPIIATVTGAGDGRLADLLKPLAGDGRGPGLEILLAAFVVAMIGRALLLYVRDLRLAALQIDFVEDRRVRLIAALAAADWPRVVGLRHAAMTSLLTTEVGRVAAATHHLIQGSVAATMLAGQVLLAFLLAPAIAVWLVAMLAIGVVLSLLGGSRARAIGESVVDANRALVESSGNYLGGLKIAVAQGAQPWFVAEFRAVQRRLSAQSLAFIRRTSRARMTFGVGSAMAGALVVWAGVRSGLDASALIALIVVLARMIGPATILQQAAQNLFHAIPSFEALVAMEAGLASETPSAATTVALPEGALTLSSVAYRHPGGGGIGDVTLALAEGEFVGVTGPSGSGKTSLVDLIAGLVVPHDGTISIGGTRFDDSVRASWRSVVSYVGQDGFLFPDSVRRNLVWDLSPSDDEIGEALRLVGADRVVAGLEQGLETMVGERGARLSGGERQRLALARAVLRRPRLLILDEATSALDVASEREILTRLAALAPRPMIVIVAHRAESLALCDRIIRVEKGRVIS